jgi:hypothetical protein
MRLLKIEENGEFSLTPDIISPTTPYAILSHTWGQDQEEVNFEDINSSSGKTKEGYRKLRFCGEQARRDGLHFFWIDTCCIDKTNAVELAEAIKSMFRWYQEADVCYAFLSDVSIGGTALDVWSKYFITSRWFKRGCTLQELLAPKKLSFYDENWQSLGDRSELSTMVQKATGIPRPFLSGWARLSDASVAQKMSWAAKRTTKREEYMAYSLLGIFDISMTMIYGEGKHAFRRLQEEIIKTTDDHSLFAWGLHRNKQTPIPFGVRTGSVLAKYPADFDGCGHIARRQDPAKAKNINPFSISNGCLSITLPIYISTSYEAYGILQCGPELENSRVVGIPLQIDGEQIGSSTGSCYFRPSGHFSYLFHGPSLKSSFKTVTVELNSPQTNSIRKNWIHITQSERTNLNLLEVHPRESWHRRDSMISTEIRDNEEHSNGDRRYLARFQPNADGYNTCQDILLVLNFYSTPFLEVDFYFKFIPRGASLEDLEPTLHFRNEFNNEYMLQLGQLRYGATVTRGSIAGLPMFVVDVWSQLVASDNENTPLLWPRRTPSKFTRPSLREWRRRRSLCCELITLFLLMLITTIILFITEYFPNTSEVIVSNIAATAFTDSYGQVHRTIVFQDQKRTYFPAWMIPPIKDDGRPHKSFPPRVEYSSEYPLLGLRWDSWSATTSWEMYNLSKFLKDTATTSNSKTYAIPQRQTPLAMATSDNGVDRQTHIFFVDEDSLIRHVWHDENASWDAGWSLAEPEIKAKVSNCSQLSVAWTPCPPSSNSTCQSGIIYVAAIFDGTLSTYHSTDWSKPLVSNNLTIGKQGMTLFPNIDINGIITSNLTLIVPQKVEDDPLDHIRLSKYHISSTDWSKSVAT